MSQPTSPRSVRSSAWSALILALVVWATATLAFVALAVLLDAAELPPFSTSSRWAPAIGGMVAILPARWVFRAVRRS